MKKIRQTKTARTGFVIREGKLYMHDEIVDEDILCGDLDAIDDDPIDLAAYPVIRLESLGNNWYQNVWIPEIAKYVQEDINVQMTLRSELRSGELYIYAYRRVFGKLYKRYVGRSTEVNSKKLLDVARKMPS